MTRLTEISSTPTQAEVPRKHCWECLRRRLVCDSARPVCTRCRNNGIVCPGYDEKQPLRWVKPGRNRRRPKAGSSSASKNDGHGGDELQSDSAALSVISAMQSKALDTILRFEITCENFAAMQASYTYNVETYERCSPLKLLLEDSRFMLPTVAAYSVLPLTIKALFILMTMAYQIHKLPRDTEKQVFVRARSATAYWSYQVVHALNEDISEEKTRASNQTMTSVILLIFADQQLRPSCRWRLHYSGLMKMIQLRGGVEKLWRECPHLRNGILMMMVMEVFGNTTSPSNDQLADLTHPKNLDFLQFAWGDVIQPVYLGSICPPSLLLDIVRINHLRALAMRGVASVLHTSRENNEDNDENNNMPAHADAQAILDHALAFSPEELADKNANERTRASWLLMGRVHQSAVVLYCILALQHVRLLPSRKSAAIERAASAHYDRLLLDLKEGFRQVHFKTCLFWPLVVAGARAARGSAFERAFITEQLGEAVKDIGSSMPVLARATLVRFWESGKTGWDECFDQPYIFVT